VTGSPVSCGRDQERDRERDRDDVKRLIVPAAWSTALIAGGRPIRRRGTVRTERVDGRLVLSPVRHSCCLHCRQSQENCVSCPLAQRDSND
jgi:hypothetical protein